MVVVVVRWGTERENMILLDARAHGRPRKGLASRRWTGTGKESSSQVEEMVDPPPYITIHPFLWEWFPVS